MRIMTKLLITLLLAMLISVPVAYADEITVQNGLLYQVPPDCCPDELGATDGDFTISGGISLPGGGSRTWTLSRPTTVTHYLAYMGADVRFRLLSGEELVLNVTSSSTIRTLSTPIDNVTAIHVTNNSNYSRKIHEINIWGYPSPAPDTEPPSAPQGLTVEPTDGGGVATWQPNSEPDLEGYRIYLDGQLRNGTLIKGTRYEFDYLNNGQTYTVQVSAVDDSGNESEKSAPVTFIPEEPPPPVDDPPGSPRGLTAKAGATEVILSWQPNREPDIAGYILYRNGVRMNATLITTTSYTDKIVSPGTEYSYYLIAVDDAGQESESSDPVTVTTLTEAVVTPPSTVSATANKQDTTITVAWSAVPDANEYHVYRNGVLIGTTSATTYTDNNVEIGETYFYEITSIIGGVESDLSPIARARITPDIGFNDGVTISIPDMIESAWSFLQRYWAYVTVVLGVMFAPFAIRLLIWLMRKLTGKDAKRIDKQIKSSKPTMSDPKAKNKLEIKGNLGTYGYNRALTAREKEVLNSMNDTPGLTKQEKEAWRRKYKEADEHYERLTKQRRYRERDTWAREKGYVRPEKREAWTRSDRVLRSSRTGRGGRSGRN